MDGISLVSSSLSSPLEVCLLGVADMGEIKLGEMKLGYRGLRKELEFIGPFTNRARIV